MASNSTLNQTPELPNFYLPFGGKLDVENRWIKLSSLMPWDLIEACYAESLADGKIGAPAHSGRVAYGAQIIKEKLGITDREVVEQVSENPYLQIFLGYTEFLKEPPFDASMMVHFRNRFTAKHHQRINEELIPSPEHDDEDPPSHSGKLLVDATCTPADIKYPTDLGLLNDARQKTEDIIDLFHDKIVARALAQGLAAPKKPRTYRKRARKGYLSISMAKSVGAKKRRAEIRKQLGYVRRNRGHISQMLEAHPDLLTLLDNATYKKLLVIGTVYEQQKEMHELRAKRVNDRIVSLSQPHIRPIIRGKAGKKVEFGAKISLSHRPGGYVTLHRISWDAYNESGDLIEQIEYYYARYGCYPESVHADKIYLTKANRAYCKERGIRLSGKPLGRPKKETEANKAELEQERAQRRQDDLDRIPVEGKFGIAKRKGSLDRVMTKLSRTSESLIHVAIVVLNLDQKLRELLYALRSILNRSYYSLKFSLRHLQPSL